MDACSGSDAMSAMLSRPARSSPRRVRKSTDCWGPFCIRTRRRAALAHRMAEDERANERHAPARRLESRARDYKDDVEIMRKLLGSGWEDELRMTPDAAEGSIAEHEEKRK